MQVHRIQNNNYNSPYFKGKIILFDAYKLKPFDRVLEKEIPAEADKLLHDEFVQLVGLKPTLICGFGLRHKSSNYTEFLKKMKEISGIDTEKLSSGDKDRMFGYSFNEESYGIEINGKTGITLRHDADFPNL